MYSWLWYQVSRAQYFLTIHTRNATFNTMMNIISLSYLIIWPIFYAKDLITILNKWCLHNITIQEITKKQMLDACSSNIVWYRLYKNSDSYGVELFEVLKNFCRILDKQKNCIECLDLIEASCGSFPSISIVLRLLLTHLITNCKCWEMFLEVKNYIELFEDKNGARLTFWFSNYFNWTWFV